MLKEEDKIIINIQEVLDYAYCPMMYKYKYIDNLGDRYKTELEKYDICMHKCIYNFFTQAQFNKISIANLKASFASNWIKTNSITNIIYSEPSSWRDTENEKRKQGIEAIIKFYNLIKDNVGIPLVINKDYKVQMTSKIYLTGTFEVIREVANKKGDKNIEILSIISDGKFYNDMCLEKDLKVSAASYAFRKTFETREDIIKFYSIDKSKMYNTNRNKEDYKMLLNTVVNVCKCIHNEIFYICPTKKCHKCAYKKLCLKT